MYNKAHSLATPSQGRRLTMHQSSTPRLATPSPCHSIPLYSTHQSGARVSSNFTDINLDDRHHPIRNQSINRRAKCDAIIITVTGTLLLFSSRFFALTTFRPLDKRHNGIASIIYRKALLLSFTARAPAGRQAIKPTSRTCVKHKGDTNQG